MIATLYSIGLLALSIVYLFRSAFGGPFCPTKGKYMVLCGLLQVNTYVVVLPSIPFISFKLHIFDDGNSNRRYMGPFRDGTSMDLHFLPFRHSAPDRWHVAIFAESWQISMRRWSQYDPV